MKTFYSAEDIEKLADQGQREIRIDENVVLTDVAKQTAHMLGIRLTESAANAAPAAVPSAAARPVTRTKVLGGKPKGCQRRPANKSAAAPGPSAGQSSPVVDKLVEKIKRISGRNG
jgi:hypothetical protein